MLQQITRGGELGLASSLTVPTSAGADRLSQLMIEAVTRQVNGEHQAARGSLQLAWESAAADSARIADFTAGPSKDHWRSCDGARGKSKSARDPPHSGFVGRELP